MSSEESVTVDGDDARKLREELKALKEKTALWKTAVKTQLDEASAKNARLREELTMAQKRAEAVAADVRLQLTAEFKERTAAKDAEIQRLVDEMRTLRHEAAATEQRLRADTEQVKLDVEHHHRSILTAAEAAERVRLEHIASIHQAELENERRRHDATQAELRAATARANEAMQQVASLKQDLAEATSAVEGAADRRRDERHTVEITSLEERLIERDGQIRSLQARLAADAARHEQVLSTVADKKDAQYQAELARRDEQLHVASVMLAQARDEAANAVKRAQVAEQEAAAAVDASKRRAATVTAELAAKVAAVNQLQSESKNLIAANERLQCQLNEALEESASREQAFTDLFERDFNRDGIQRLEALLRTATSEKERLEARVKELEKERTDLTEAASQAAQQHAATQHELDERLSLLAGREEQLKDLERRVCENQIKVAQQAQQLQMDQQQRHHDGRAKKNDLNDDDHFAALRVDPWVSQLRAGRLMLETQGSLLFHRYRRLLPFVLLGILLATLYVFAGTAATSDPIAASIRVEHVDSLATLRRQHDATLKALIACEAACPTTTMLQDVRRPPPATSPSTSSTASGAQIEKKR